MARSNYPNVIRCFFLFSFFVTTGVGHADHICRGGLEPLTSCTTIPQALQGYDGSSVLNINTPAEANRVRQNVIDYFWPSGGGLPINTFPTVSTVYSGIGPFTGELVGRLGAVESSLVSQVERLDSNVQGLENVSYLMRPASAGSKPKLAIVHQGHQDWPLGNVDTTSNFFLEQGYSVLTMNMPLVGWNSDQTAVLPSGPVTWPSLGSAGHNQMFPLPNPEIDGDNSFRFFIEPVVTGINHFVDQNPDYASILMTGLSGGGWTTAVVSAVDARIDLSIPVAGSYPLALRAAQNGSAGDDEQLWEGLYAVEGGGVASWVDLYVLSGYGEGRRSIQVSNQFDPCCFYGILGTLYERTVANAVAELGAGEWSFQRDASHHSHIISQWNLSTVIGPAVGIPEPSSLVLATLGFLTSQLLVGRWRRQPMAR